MKRAKQSEFLFQAWGGARTGAGRKPKGERARASHQKRPSLASRHPVHVTLRIAGGFESLRKRPNFRAVRAALFGGANRLDLRLVEFSVMTHHLHLVCEAADERALGRAIKGISVRIARALNRIWDRTGSVFQDRYHVHALKTPSEVRNALGYVLRNAAHHGHHFAGPDPCSSGKWFDGWRQSLAWTLERAASPLPRARTWLLAHGWRRLGPIDLRV